MPVHGAARGTGTFHMHDEERDVEDVGDALRDDREYGMKCTICHDHVMHMGHIVPK